EHAQQRSTEEKLRQTQASLDPAVGQQNQNTTPPQTAPVPSPTSSPKSMFLSKPQPFNGTRGASAKSFFGPILLHSVTYPGQFPTESRKVAFAVSFMTDYAETWSQPYLMKVINAEEVAFDEFLDDFRPAYTQEFNSHACTVGWADTPLMSLKENIQLAVVMSNIEFTSFWTMQAMALKEGQTIEGIWNPPNSSSAPTPTPMQWNSQPSNLVAHTTNYPMPSAITSSS
ncbi:uncharacterized protein VP01_1777g3, partial [Puccinia sorghi]